MRKVLFHLHFVKAENLQFARLANMPRMTELANGLRLESSSPDSWLRRRRPNSTLPQQRMTELVGKSLHSLYCQPNEQAQQFLQYFHTRVTHSGT